MQNDTGRTGKDGAKLAKNRAKTGSAGLSRRLHFPEDEERHSWLSALLDAFAVADTGVAVAVRDAGKKGNKKLACARNCDICCRQTNIPLSPHELTGLRWYVSEKLSESLRPVVIRQCGEHAKGSPCPFLVDHACAVHPLRPVACRQYNVFTVPCSPGEDPYYSRRDDVLDPLPDYRDRSFAAVVLIYGLENDRDEENAVTSVKEKIMNLQEQDWKRLIQQAG